MASSSSSSVIKKRKMEVDKEVEEGELPKNAPIKNVILEQIHLGPVSDLEGMNHQVLKFQHEQLKQLVNLKEKEESDLKKRIEDLEKRHYKDNLEINAINRYWNQLNEDIDILLQRFDLEIAVAKESKDETETGHYSFLVQVSTWDQDKLDKKMSERVQMSKEVISKIVSAFECLRKRYENMNNALMKGYEVGGSSHEVVEALKAVNVGLEAENHKIHELNTALHAKYRVMSLKIQEWFTKLSASEENRNELQKQVDDLKWELSKLLFQNNKLATSLQDLQEKYKALQQSPSTGYSGNIAVEDSFKDLPLNAKERERRERELDYLREDNKDLKELADNRLAELKEYSAKQTEVLQELDTLRLEIKQLSIAPGTAAVEDSVEYKTLQTHFSVVYDQNLKLRDTLKNYKQKIIVIREEYIQHIRKMEEVERKTDEQLREDMVKKQKVISDLQKSNLDLKGDLEKLKLEKEQMESMGNEMRDLIKSLETYKEQLKRDCHRYHRRYKESYSEYEKIKVKYMKVQATVATYGGDPSLKNGENVNVATTSTATTDPDTPENKPKEDEESIVSSNEADELRAKLNKTLEEGKEMRLLLDSYKATNQELRTPDAIQTSNEKLEQELETLRDSVKKLQQENEEFRKGKLTQEQAKRRLKAVESQVHALQRQLTTQKQEEGVLITEMEVIGQALEETQEQNNRLQQQLREKDEMNFRLMSDRIQASQLEEMGKEEKDYLKQQVEALKQQVNAQADIIDKSREVEKTLCNNLEAKELENVKLLQGIELHKSKTIEVTEADAQLKMKLAQNMTQLEFAQQLAREKTAAYQEESFKTKRYEEEIATMRKQLERLNKSRVDGCQDEVLLEEIRELKEILTCPSCRVRRKDAVLTKCFHVFCFECLRTRYETRQRKCPECNAIFGAHDYSRLYLT